MTTNADPESIVNDPGRGFMGHLAFLPVGRGEHVSSIQHYPYQGRKQFLVDYEIQRHRHRSDTGRDSSEWFLLTGVDSQVFENEFLEPVDQNSPWTSWSSYDAHMQLLLVRITKSPAHETASMAFNTILLEAVELTELKRSLRQIGSATHFASMGAKEPDQAWRPRRLPPGRSRDWPSTVIEIAYSETECKLLSDVRFWMRASGGDVKVVLTLRIDRQQPKIRIEKWVSSSSTNSRHHLDQSVTISKAQNNHVIVSNAPLIIGFEELFLRPASIPRERSIEVDAEKLEYLATEIWDELLLDL